MKIPPSCPSVRWPRSRGRRWPKREAELLRSDESINLFHYSMNNKRISLIHISWNLSANRAVPTHTACPSTATSDITLEIALLKMYIVSCAISTVKCRSSEVFCMSTLGTPQLQCLQAETKINDTAVDLSRGACREQKGKNVLSDNRRYMAILRYVFGLWRLQ